MRSVGEEAKNLLDAEDAEEVPDDPVTERPFIYRHEGSKTVLEVSAPKGGRPRDAVHYELTVAR